MNKTLKWVLIALGIALAAFLISLPIFRMSMYGSPQGFARMGGFRSGMMLPFAGLFMFFRYLVPLGVLALAIVGVVLLVRNSSARNQSPLQPAQLPGAPRVCVKCAKILHDEGEYCPFCGEKQ